MAFISPFTEPAPPKLLPITVPLHTPEVIVPRLVKLDPITLDAKAVPVKVSALAAAGATELQVVPFEVKIFPAVPGELRPVPPFPAPMLVPFQATLVPS